MPQPTATPTPRRTRGVRLAALALVALAGVAAAERGDYLDYVTFEMPGRENVLLHWPARRMPLRVYLPPPPEGLFPAPDAVREAVRRGVLAWEGAAGPDLPRFVFVDDQGDADIPMVWSKPAGDWFVAQCMYDIDVMQRRFGVARIDVSARRPGGEVALESDIELIVSHEIGHALGLGGHSPDPADVMHRTETEQNRNGLSARDKQTLRKLYAKPNGARVVGAKRERDAS